MDERRPTDDQILALWWKVHGNKRVDAWSAERAMVKFARDLLAGRAFPVAIVEQPAQNRGP